MFTWFSAQSAVDTNLRNPLPPVPVPAPAPNPPDVRHIANLHQPLLHLTLISVKIKRKNVVHAHKKIMGKYVIADPRDVLVTSSSDLPWDQRSTAMEFTPALDENLRFTKKIYLNLCISVTESLMAHQTSVFSGSAMFLGGQFPLCFDLKPWSLKRVKIINLVRYTCITFVRWQPWHSKALSDPRLIASWANLDCSLLPDYYY